MVNPDTFLIVLFYVITLGGGVVVACSTKWSSGALRSRIGRAVVGILIGATLLEFSSLLALRINYGYWIYSRTPNPNAWIFEQHPNMVSGVKSNEQYVMRLRRGPISLSHNSLGFRGSEFGPKGNLKRIVAIGGSTTYGVSVSDAETWPAHLGQKLGEGYEVLNLGSAGHGTAEHLYMVGAVASRLVPDVVILHIGLNDMHCMHAPDTTLLVNRCHSDLLFLSAGQCFVNRLPRLAMIHALVSSLQNADLVPRCPLGPDGKNDFATLDPRVVDDFKARTVALISAVVGMGARVVVVPQVGFHKAALARGIYKWWTPYLDQSALSALMKDFNKELRGIAQRMNVPYVESVDQSVWSDDLFIDVSHLNGKGNERLAALLVPEVRKVAPLTGE